MNGLVELKKKKRQWCMSNIQVIISSYFPKLSTLRDPSDHSLMVADLKTSYVPTWWLVNYHQVIYTKYQKLPMRFRSDSELYSLPQEWWKIKVALLVSFWWCCSPVVVITFLCWFQKSQERHNYVHHIWGNSILQADCYVF